MAATGRLLLDALVRYNQLYEPYAIAEAAVRLQLSDPAVTPRAKIQFTVDLALQYLDLEIAAYKVEDAAYQCELALRVMCAVASV
jgi:hypothetical protein